VAVAPARRPNIVFILADDLDFRTTAMMPRLPALIGQHGRTFDRAYVTQALCAPSRASILTGQFPHNHRVLDNSGPDGGFGAFRRGPEASTIATWLRAAGYRHRPRRQVHERLPDRGHSRLHRARLGRVAARRRPTSPPTAT
jgi:arylsulfatase A-like enzyme